MEKSAFLELEGVHDQNALSVFKGMDELRQFCAPMIDLFVSLIVLYIFYYDH